MPSSGDHEMGSSKLEISNIVNFGWEFQYCPGQLVAIHKSGSFFAYGLVSPGKYISRDIEGGAKVMRRIFFFIVFLKFMMMPLSVCILKVHTLTIPKW